MGQHHQVQAVRFERQGREIRDQGRPQLRRVGRRGLTQGQPLMRHAVGLQGVEFGKAELQRVISENVTHGAVELGALPCQEVTTGRGLEPLPHSYNLVAHEVNPAAGLPRQLPLGVA
jgi:hypothetical protein